MERFPFDFALPLSLPLRLAGITPGTAHVDVDDNHVEVWFGPFKLATALSNIEDVRVTGPYNLLKAYGVRLSLSDLGLTFGTTSARGVCISFREPVAALPGGLVRHPSLTVTVAEPERLERLLRRTAHAPRPLLAAVEADEVPNRPVVEPEEDRLARERAVRRARKAARTRAEHRAEERAEAEEATARRSAAAKRGAAKRAAASGSTGSTRTPAKRTTSKRAPAKRTAKRTPAKATAGNATATNATANATGTNATITNAPATREPATTG